MEESKRITHEFMQSVQISDTPLDRLLVPTLLAIGIAYAGWQVLQGDWAEAAFFGAGVVLLLALAAFRPLQQRVLGRRFNRRHALYIVFFWIYGVAWLNLVRLLALAQSSGKGSTYYYALLITILAFSLTMIRSLLLLTPRFQRIFISRIPIWEQLLVAINEGISIGLLALFASNLLVRLFQPDIFTTRFDAAYTLGIGLVIGLYFIGMQLMWLQRWNDWLGKNAVWVRLARIIAPLAALITMMVIANYFIERSDPRTANLLGDSNTNLAVLSLAPVILLMILVIILLVYTSNKGLRQRFLPDLLLDRLPMRVARFLRSISDMDMLLIIGVMATSIPAYLLLLGDTGGVIGTLRQQILQRGSALIETSEQALAVLFAMPFYFLAIALLAVYALVISRSSLTAHERDELIAKLPVGFLIILVITLYLFAVPFSQVLAEGRLPQLPQDSGRILLFNILIPLVLLYLHYFLFVRVPYGRGQSRWREAHTTILTRQLNLIDRRIQNLNQELEHLDRQWQQRSDANAAVQFDTLYRYVQLNGMRDDMNMQRLQLVAERQQLAEISETPVSVTVARLPIRVVSIGIPLLLAIQIYQWAVLNNGLREIANNPNVNVVDFFRAILSQLQF
jgi:hypothetical protein